MSSHFLLKNLFALSKSMKANNFEYQVVNNINFKKELELCALFKFDYEDFKDKKYDEQNSNKKYIMGLFKRKTNQYLKLPLIYKNRNGFEAFEIPLPLEKKYYDELREFLEIDFSKDGKFVPIDFFRVLNNAIPTRANNDNLDRKVCSYSYPTITKNEKDKIYFSHFLNNDKSGKKRSLENLEKTQKILPFANELIGSSNISVCFTDIPKDLQTELKEIQIKYNEIKQ